MAEEPEFLEAFDTAEKREEEAAADIARGIVEARASGEGGEESIAKSEKSAKGIEREKGYFDMDLETRLGKCEGDTLCKVIIKAKTESEAAAAKATVERVMGMKPELGKFKWDDTKTTGQNLAEMGKQQDILDAVAKQIAEDAKRSPAPAPSGAPTEIVLRQSRTASALSFLKQLSIATIAGMLIYADVANTQAKGSYCAYRVKGGSSDWTTVKCEPTDQSVNEVDFKDALSAECTCDGTAYIGPCGNFKSCQTLTKGNCQGFDPAQHTCVTNDYNFNEMNIWSAALLAGQNALKEGVTAGGNFMKLLEWITAHLGLIGAFIFILMFGGFFISIFRTFKYSSAMKGSE